MEGQIVVEPIGRVRSPRVGKTDDFWGDVESVIELDTARFGPDAVLGLAEFSHLEVVFHLHLVPEDSVSTGTRHPRGRLDWPEVGVFAQRAKARPNRIGVSRCRLIRVEGTRLVVEGLDAMDGTPVLDVKPWIDAFGPIGPVRQPAWATELMRDYYARGGGAGRPGI